MDKNTEAEFVGQLVGKLFEQLLEHELFLSRKEMYERESNRISSPVQLAQEAGFLAAVREVKRFFEDRGVIVSLHFDQGYDAN